MALATALTTGIRLLAEWGHDALHAVLAAAVDSALGGTLPALAATYGSTTLTVLSAVLYLVATSAGRRAGDGRGDVASEERS